MLFWSARQQQAAIQRYRFTEQVRPVRIVTHHLEFHGKPDLVPHNKNNNSKKNDITAKGKKLAGCWLTWRKKLGGGKGKRSWAEIWQLAGTRCINTILRGRRVDRSGFVSKVNLLLIAKQIGSIDVGFHSRCLLYRPGFVLFRFSRALGILFGFPWSVQLRAFIVVILDYSVPPE